MTRRHASRRPTPPGEQLTARVGTEDEDPTPLATSSTDVMDPPLPDLRTFLDDAVMKAVLEGPGAPPPPAPAEDRFRDSLEELADDMLQIMLRLASIEQTQAEVVDRLDRLERRASGDALANLQGLDQVRRDIIGERRHLSTVGVFNAVHPWMNALERMRARLDAEQTPELRFQLDTVVDLLAALFRSLGFVTFNVETGEPFDPARMRVAGYAAGRAGVVLSPVSPGYEVNGAVVQPADVLIADPSAIDVQSKETHQ